MVCASGHGDILLSAILMLLQLLEQAVWEQDHHPVRRPPQQPRSGLLLAQSEQRAASNPRGATSLQSSNRNLQHEFLL